ncbi:MAG: flavin reductase family protein, partial [Paraprevotella sp.]|nr:flavin reductase family protein [Paraprevotella sp.]
IVCSGDADRYNMMTASWGGIGWLWNKPVAFVFIRPERYTFEFTESNDYITLSFLGHSKEARNIYNLCGSKSGRDMDKMHESGLTPIPVTDGKCIAFQQARLTLVCKKLYADDLKPEKFIASSLDEKWYGGKQGGYQGGYHKMYIIEIIEALLQEA